MSATPKSMWPAVKAMLHSVYDEPDAASVHAQFDRLLDYVAGKLAAVAEHLDAARADILAFAAFAKDVWTRIWSNNPSERLNEEIPAAPTPSHNRDAIVRLVGAVLTEQTDEWAEGRGYLGLEVLARCRLTTITAAIPPSPVSAVGFLRRDPGPVDRIRLRAPHPLAQRRRLPIPSMVATVRIALYSEAVLRRDLRDHPHRTLARLLRGTCHGCHPSMASSLRTRAGATHAAPVRP